MARLRPLIYLFIKASKRFWSKFDKMRFLKLCEYSIAQPAASVTVCRANPRFVVADVLATCVLWLENSPTPIPAEAGYNFIHTEKFCLPTGTCSLTNFQTTYHRTPFPGFPVLNKYSLTWVAGQSFSILKNRLCMKTWFRMFLFGPTTTKMTAHFFWCSFTETINTSTIASSLYQKAAMNSGFDSFISLLRQTTWPYSVSISS